MDEVHHHSVELTAIAKDRKGVGFGPKSDADLGTSDLLKQGLDVLEEGSDVKDRQADRFAASDSGQSLGQFVRALFGSFDALPVLEVVIA